MRKLSALDAKNRFGGLLDTAQREPVTIEKHGRPVAVVVSVTDYREIEALRLAHLRAEIDRGLADISEGRTVEGADAFADARAGLDQAAGTERGA